MEEDTITEHETQARGRLTGLAQGPAVRWQVEPGEPPDLAPARSASSP